MARALWQRLSGGKQIVLASTRDGQEGWAVLEADLGTGKAVPVIDKVFPLEKAAEAIAAVDSGGTAGKVVIQVS